MRKTKWFNLKNLRPKLILAFALVLMIPSIVIGASSYFAAQKAIEQELLFSIEENVNILNLSIDNAILPKLNDADKLASMLTSTDLQDQNIARVEEIFKQYVELHPEVDAIYVTRPDGSLIIYPDAELGADFDARQREWYKEAMAKKDESIISEPYVSVTTNEVTVAISHSTSDGTGVIGIDLKMGHLQELSEHINIGDEGYALILDQHGKYISHPENEPGSKATEPFYQNLYKDTNGTFEYELDGKPKVMGYSTNEVTGWKVAGNVYSEEISTAASPILNMTIIVLVIAFIVGAVIVLFIIRSIIAPLKSLKDKAMTISNGDLTETIEVKSTDEIGELGQAFITMRDNLTKLLRSIEENAEQVAASAEQLSASSQETSAATEEVSTSIQQVSASTERQKDGAEASVQSLAEISEGASHIAESSSKVTDLATDATKHAEEGSESVGNIMNKMQTIQDLVSESNRIIESLTERSKQIDSILKIITGIAEQTNLLSLNASIEAARAGEHGKGFAVVANEVKKLAEQSRESAKDISEIINAIQSDTESTNKMMTLVTKGVEEGVEVSNEAVKKFYQILESMNNVTPQMFEVSSTTKKVSDSIRETTSVVSEQAILAQENAAISEQVAASSQQQLAAMEEISASAQSLTEMAEELRTLIAKFKY
nr:methyl-accepting chemotaxis protein [Lysinibacillus timonensis]